jgi:ElaB/YqjD/DUF883 family membrane-anchored ribosome-binding protein
MGTVPFFPRFSIAPAVTYSLVEDYAMTDENTTNSAGYSPNDVCAAAEALNRAKAEMERAHAFYEHVREQTAHRIKAARETTVGDMLDCTLKAVKRHPGAGLTLAAIVGFMLGRLFRR